MLGITGHRIGDAWRSAVSSLSGQSKESQFVEKGMLTPDEFVEAGEQLTYKFPTWKWEAGDASLRSSYLPADKQYLITRNVPCRDRVRALDYVLDHQTRSEDDWLIPDINYKDGRRFDPELDGRAVTFDEMRRGLEKHELNEVQLKEHWENLKPAGEAEEIRDIDDLTKEAQEPPAALVNDESPGLGIMGAQDDFISAPADGLPDFSDLDAELAEKDPGMQDVPAFGGGSGGYVVAEAPDAHIVRARTYDLSITYDKYYQVPRLWLFGYDEHNQPLKPEEVYEDVLSEYVSKTVTVDPHPLTGTPTVSIHPCKHSLVMKKVVQDWVARGIEPRHDLAILVILKFISGIVPTINYDFTMDVEFF